MKKALYQCTPDSAVALFTCGNDKHVLRARSWLSLSRPLNVRYIQFSDRDYLNYVYAVGPCPNDLRGA